MSAPIDLVNLLDLEAAAKARMEPAAYDYFAGGADAELTLADNRRAFDRFALRPRVLVGVDQVDTSTVVLGTKLAVPVGLAPTAFNKLAHPDGERAAARAAGDAGTVMCCSTISSTCLEDVAAIATGPLWFQLYVYRDRSVTEDLIHRAEASGYQALVLTVDTPRLGRRERDVRNRFALPDGISIANLAPYGADATRWPTSSNFTEYVHRLLDASLTWESVEWLRSSTKLPVLIKGVLTAADAELAAAHGASGVIVSNHGGRQLDGSIATIDALPEVASQVAGRLTVLLDGGVRRGTDVLKALALGASAVMIGRPYLWGLAADGEAGVRRALEMLRVEFELALALAGCRSVADVTSDLVQTRVL